MTTNTNDRAARFLAIAAEYGYDGPAAYAIADAALDVEPDSYLHQGERDLAHLADTLFRGDDDYDDFRHELRVILGPPFADDVDARWDDADI